MSNSSSAQTSNQLTQKVVPVIQAWLDTHCRKILQFWIGADQWRFWARYDLFVALEHAFEEDYLVNHSMNIWETYNENERVDILLEHRDGGTNLAIHLVCENVNENCGSFEDFSKEYQKEWTQLDNVLRKHIEQEFVGTKVMLLGFSGEPMGYADDEPKFGNLKPESFKAGEVYAWYSCSDTDAQTNGTSG